MSLLEKASLVVTPNAYKASKLYSVVPNTTLGDMNVVRATTATRVNSAGFIESVAINVPRIDYSNGSCPSILVEPQRTNLALNSDGNLSTYPTAINVTNASSSFNSFSNAIQFPNTGLALAYKSVVTTAQTYAISVFIKMDDNSVPILSASTTTGNMCLVIAGAVVTNNLKVESYGNNVYRLSGTATSGAVNINNGLIRYDTQVLKSFKITGIQLEAASYPTSYIPTVASSVTRNADVISKTGISSLIGQTEGTIFVDVYKKSNEAQTIVSIEDWVSNSKVIRILSDSNNSIACQVFDSGTQFSASKNDVVIGNRYKCALAYKNNDFAFYINGTQISVSSSGTVAASVNFNIGKFQATGEMNGDINSAQLYKTRLTNAELAQLTTI